MNMVTEEAGAPVESAQEVPDSTQGAAGVADATPGESKSDATSWEEERKKYEESIKTLSSDMNAMKASLQKRQAQMEREWKDREAALQKELEATRLASMDDEERKTYEASSSSRKAAELERALSEERAARVQLEEMTKARTFFIDQGVPPDALDMTGGYDALWASGMSALLSELKEHRSKRAEGTKKTPPQAPPVVKSNGVPASPGTRWDELKKRYGTEEEVYRLVETGQLPADVIPV